jgi:hypothetical protein
MTDMKRHIGKLRNTDRKVVVVYMQIPDREDHALIVDTDSLPARFHQPLMKVVESLEGQQKMNLGDLLGVRIMGDTGNDMMSTLHREGYLTAVPADLVIMYPKPNMPVPLSSITAQFANTSTDIQALPAEIAVEQPKFNPYANAQNESNERQMEFTARNLLVEAELLEGEAKKKRNLAYTYAPHLAKPTEFQPTLIVENSEGADKKPLDRPGPKSRKKAISE